MRVSNVLTATKLGLSYVATGAATNWFMSEDSLPEDASAAIVSMSNLPVEAMVEEKQFILLETKLISALTGQSAADYSLAFSKVTTDSMWELKTPVTMRSKRFGSVGVEALTGVEGGTTIGVKALEITVNPSELIELLISKEVEQFPHADKALRKRVEQKLSEVIKYASFVKEKCVAYIPYRYNEAWEVYHPCTSSGLITSTGRTVLANGLYETAASSSYSDLFAAYMTVLDSDEVNSEIDIEGAQESVATSEPAIQVATLNSLLASNGKDKTTPRGGLILSDRDVGFWYLLVKSAFLADRSPESQLKRWGFSTMREAAIYASQGNRFVLIPTV